MTSTPLPTSNMSASSLQNHEFITNGILVPAICIVGILFNIAILIILHSKKHFPESTYIYLFDLALADLLTLCFFATNCSGRAYFPDSYDWRVYEVYFYFPFGSMVSNASILLTVTVTVERYIFIYRPLLSKLYCTPLIAGKVTKCIWIFCFIFNLPRFFVMRPEEGGKLGFTWFGTNLVYKIIVWVYFIVTSAGASLVLIVFNVMLILAIHRRRRQQAALKGVDKQQETRSRLDTIQREGNFMADSNLSSCSVLTIDAEASTGNKTDEETPPKSDRDKLHQSNQNCPSKNEFKTPDKPFENQNNYNFVEIKQHEADNNVSSPKTSDSNKVNGNKKFKQKSNVTKKAKTNKKLSLRQQQKQRDDFTLTLTLIGLVVVFLLGEVPSALLSRNTVVPFWGEEVLEKAWYRRALMVCTLLVVNQHSTNFIIYCALNNKFCAVAKKSFKQIKCNFCRR